MLEGWNLVIDPRWFNGQQVFEIWSSGDKMPDGSAGPSKVYAGAGNGKNWLSLNDGNGQGHQTLGIARSVQTAVGATYSLSFDYAAQVGASTAYTGISVYVDGVKIACYADCGGATSLDWQTLTFEFAGNGRARDIRIVADPAYTLSNSRGAMIDDIALVEQWPENEGNRVTRPAGQDRLVRKVGPGSVPEICEGLHRPVSQGGDGPGFQVDSGPSPPAVFVDPAPNRIVERLNRA